MNSAIIVSETLGKVAEKVEIPERNIIYSWNDFDDRTIDEDIIVLDTKISEGFVNHREKPIAGNGTYEVMNFLNSSLDNLVESGKTIICLFDKPQDMYATESETVGFSNYLWLPRHFGSVQVNSQQPDENFVFRTPDNIESSPLTLRHREQAFSTYFINADGTWTWLDPENSSIKEYETVAVSLTPSEEEMIAGIIVKSWEDGQGGIIQPEGRLIFLPRPSQIRIDVGKWFRSLLEIGYQYSDSPDGFDQFNRLMNRTMTSELKKVYQVCHKFPDVVRVLRERKGSKEPINVEKEADVQYIFEALLQPFFDDVRPEEWCPSYAGSASRVDFLLKGETIVIETKVTTTKTGDVNRELKQELSEDKEQYRTHPDCKNLVCYVWDPEHKVENPSGFEKDMSGEYNEMGTEVIVSSTTRFTTP